MRIGFIGAGKVGFTFGKYITTKMVVSKPEHIQLEVSGYYSAHSESAADAAEFTETVMYNSLEELCSNSEVIFLTVPDGQIGEVWRRLKDLDIRGKIICHALSLIHI